MPLQEGTHPAADANPNLKPIFYPQQVPAALPSLGAFSWLSFRAKRSLVRNVHFRDQPN